jgi:hypothetical protein
MVSLVTITPGRRGSIGTPLGPFFNLVARLCRTKSDTTFPMVCFLAAAIERAAARISSSRSKVVLIGVNIKHHASDVKADAGCGRVGRAGEWRTGDTANRRIQRMKAQNVRIGVAPIQAP